MLSVGIMRKKLDESYFKRLIIISGFLLIFSFLISFFMVINLIPPTIFILSFIAYGLSFFGIILFLYAYYQYVRLDGEDKG